MTTYLAPTRDMQFVMKELAGLDAIAQLPGYEDASADLVDAVLEEAGKLAGDVLAPLNQTGDQQGSKLEDGKVVVPDGFSEAYRQFVDNGWMGISQSPEFDGQGLPHLVQAAVSEMWNAANLSFALNPMLTSGAIEAIEAHGDDRLKAQYLPKMVNGEWCGTMNLTEPQAGSDLSVVRTKAVPNGDHYLISGQKIFITWGDHEMAENIAHLVLARLPDAPAGVKGISLFVVPKFLVNEDGSPGDLNDVHAVSLEHKMGIHASPTCVMSFGDRDGAVGYLVGEENRGLACMFTMMNHARLGVGMQGVALADRAYQQAVAYARERTQGSAPDVEGRAAIIHHADVRRMLMIMRANTEAMRAVAYVTSAALDHSHKEDSEQSRQHNKAQLDLLTPVVKAWCTEVAQEVTTLGVQVHGGMGFIEETGCAQYMRDARIITIYEGTTGIQAGDLVGRKIVHDGGAAITGLLEEMEQFESELEKHGASLESVLLSFRAGRSALVSATEWLLSHGQDNPHTLGSVAVNYLMLMGTALGGWQMARSALISSQALEQDAGDTFYQGKLAVAQFYMKHLMPRAKAYLDAVLDGEKSVMALPADLM